MINDDLLIDFGPDLYVSMQQLGLSMITVKHLLVTHSHTDHFYAGNLEFRRRKFRKTTELPVMSMVGGPSVQMAWKHFSDTGEQEQGIRRVPILPGGQVSLPPYHVQAIEARHDLIMGDAMNYIISDGKVKLLYASDTGLYGETMWNRLKGQRLDAVVMEATHGGKPALEVHLDYKGYAEMMSKMKEYGCADEQTTFFACHFSHSEVRPHDKLERDLNAMGVIAAYDGLVAELG